MHIKCYNEGQVLNQIGIDQLNKFKSKLKKGEEFYIKLITKNQFKESERSIAQNKYYHKVIMPCMVYYVAYLDGYVLPQDQAVVHKLIKMHFCYFKREDLIEIVKYKHPITGGMITEAQIPSWGFDKMPRKTANEMIDFCKEEIEKHSTTDLESALRGMM